MSSSLAVSESVGGLHPVASKCVSEDESQGVVDPNICKTIPKGIPGGSRDCEGNSTVGKICSSCRFLVLNPGSTNPCCIESIVSMCRLNFRFGESRRIHYV